MILSAALLLALAPPAPARWTAFGAATSTGIMWSIDKASIVRSGRRVSAWFRVESAGDARWREIQMRDEVDCDSHRYRTLEAIRFLVGGGSDMVGVGDWREARPGSAGEREVLALCDPKALG